MTKIWFAKNLKLHFKQRRWIRQLVEDKGKKMKYNVETLMNEIFERVYAEFDNISDIELSQGLWEDATLNYTYFARLTNTRSGVCIAESELGLESIEEALHQIVRADWKK